MELILKIGVYGVKWVIETSFLLLALWCMVKIQKLQHTGPGLLAAAAVACAFDLIPYVGHYIAVPVLWVSLTKVTREDFTGVVFTTAISYALVFGMNLFLLGALMGDLRVSARARTMPNSSEQESLSVESDQAVEGSAETTTIADHSVHIITAAQAAHWFDLPAARREFVRILRPKGWVALIWNQRITDSTPFLRAYEQLLLTYATDYEKVRHEHTTEGISSFFAPRPFQEREFPNYQDLDHNALERRLLSSSYVPLAGHANYKPMLAALRNLFDTHAANGRIRLDYTTRMFYAQLT